MSIIQRNQFRVLLAAFISVVLLTLFFQASEPYRISWNPYTYFIASAQTSGQWLNPIPVPFVTVAAAVLPTTGRVLLWAGDNTDGFNNDNVRTLTAIVDPTLGSVVDYDNVSYTGHNMFCPGLSMDSTGHPFVTGGSTDSKVSVFETDEGGNGDGRWVSYPNMTLGRGYQAQATLGDGRIFTIGGSWNGEWGVARDAEVFDPKAKSWTLLPESRVLAMLTEDARGVFAADNHAWLFAWKDASVFQAGPSKDMNWFGATGKGATVSAGPRAKDQDAMNGNAVMFDAAAGKILTLGGAQSYQDAVATEAAHLITLGEAFQAPSVEKLDNMHDARAYGNAVVLPTGDVFINGGASFAKQWTDVNASMVPEIWSPQTKKFKRVARANIPRTYHSVAVLLPDATVLTGGGGYCWKECEGNVDEINHYDIQIFVPPYLYGEDGKAVSSRPQILELEEKKLELGARVSVAVNMKVEEFSLVRYGSATHSIDTDQRRVPLVPLLEQEDDTKGKWSYQILLPNDPGVAVPGYWMLFAISDSGVPSIAETVLLQLPSPH